MNTVIEKSPEQSEITARIIESIYSTLNKKLSQLTPEQATTTARQLIEYLQGQYPLPEPTPTIPKIDKLQFSFKDLAN